jgi:1-aminocyclopropane-1-carboxylate deaminase/D-cysteine desulfhydrase-like pyridoxal-dependent ACC family enzyme
MARIVLSKSFEVEGHPLSPFTITVKGEGEDFKEAVAQLEERVKEVKEFAKAAKVKLVERERPE